MAKKINNLTDKQILKIWKTKVYNWNYKIKKRGGKISLTLTWALKIKECVYCKELINHDNASLDHKMPLSRGGKDELNNLHIVCANCNLAKGSLIDWEFALLSSSFLSQITTQSSIMILRKLRAGWRIQ